MSGAGNFAGTSYQARVIAYVYAHILAQARLGWLEIFDDTPIGVSGETDGPGDDARLEFGERHPPVEVQAKHGLKAGAKLSEAIARVREHTVPDDATEVILVVDRSSSKTVHHDFAKDLERFRGGRTDALHGEITRVLKELGPDDHVLRRLFVVGADLDSSGDADTKTAMRWLEAVLEEREHVIPAWAVLVADAAELCAKKLRRTRKELVELLRASKFTVRVPQKDERFMRQLDLSKELLAREKPSAALSVIGILDANIKAQDVEPSIRYRAAQHRASALLMLGRSTEALAAARMALDIDPKGIHALLNAAHASAEMGDLAQAKLFIDRAITVDNHNADVWGAKAQILAMAGVQPEPPPADIFDSEAYQLALAQIATNAGELQRVDEITAAVLARGSRDTKTLYLRIRALIGLSEGDDSPTGTDRRADAERLANEAIQPLAEDAPLRAKLLVVRAELRRQRGDDAGASADLEQAVEVGDHDPDAVANLALAQLHAGRADYALQTLRIRAADEYPMLLVIRAQALAETGDLAGARRDLEAATARVDEAPSPDSLRLFGAEVGLTLKDVALTERFLDAITSDALAPEMQATLRGRVAFERGDADTMQRHFRDAVDRAPRLKAKLFAELAQRLLRLGRTSDAVAIFDEVGLDGLPTPLQRDYAGALMQTHDFVRAAKLVEEIRASESAPDWALSIAAEIAARQGDIDQAIELLTRIHEKRPGDPYVLFELSRRLLGINEGAAASEYLDRLTACSSTLQPGDRMAVAHLLKEAGRIEDAMTIALAAFRAAPQDPAMHRGFGSLLATDAPPVMHPGIVTDETYVRLVSDDDVREYIVYKDPPIDPRWNELLLDDAAKMGLVGLRSGDTFVMHADTWQERRWTVAEILPAVVYIFRDVMARYEERFPSEPFFVHMMKLPDENSVKFLTPIISSLQARKERAEAIFKMYRENTLPLGFVAGMLDASIPEVMAAATAPVVELGPLRVEWFDAEGQQESRSVAREASRVVLTRSALETLAQLGLLDTVSSTYEWCAPQSLVEALRRELADAEKKLAEGQRTMMASDAGLRFDEIAPGDPSLLARVDRVRQIAEWVTSHARAEFRPLETIEAPASREEEARTTIGHDSIDAVRMAEHFNLAMLADDLGLRRLLPKGSPGRSFSTVSLIAALAERNVVSPHDAHALLLQLVERNYTAIAPSRALLTQSIQQARGANASVERMFALLGGPILDLSSAARIGAETLRAVHLLPLQLVDVARVTQMILTALSTKWPVTLSAYALVKASAVELALLPQAQKLVRETAAEFVKQRS